MKLVFYWAFSTMPLSVTSLIYSRTKDSLASLDEKTKYVLLLSRRKSSCNEHMPIVMSCMFLLENM